MKAKTISKNFEKQILTLQLQLNECLKGRPNHAVDYESVLKITESIDRLVNAYDDFKRIP